MGFLTEEKFVLKNGKTVSLRSPTNEEAQAFLDYWYHIKSESEFTYQHPQKTPATLDWYRDWITKANNSPYEIIIAAFDDNNKMIGNTSIQCPHNPHPWIGHNCSFGMGVIKNYWGEGLGFRMLQIVEREAKRMGYQQIFAEVREHNVGGRHLYAKFGFEETGKKPNFAFINGNYYDDIVIYKKI